MSNTELILKFTIISQSPKMIYLYCNYTRTTIGLFYPILNASKIHDNLPNDIKSLKTYFKIWKKYFVYYKLRHCINLQVISVIFTIIIELHYLLEIFVCTYYNLLSILVFIYFYVTIHHNFKFKILRPVLSSTVQIIC